MEKVFIMAKFFKGDFAKVVPYPDYSWEHWDDANTKLCKKVCKILKVQDDVDWVDEIFVEVEFGTTTAWFKDSHLVKIDDYNEVFHQNMKKACEDLARHEAICKKLRDEILEEVFIGEQKEKDKKYEDIAPDDQFFDEDDWQEVTTKEIIPLPGNGGTMTSVPDPKKSANTRRKSIRSKIKQRAKKHTQAVSSSSGSTDVWSLTEEDIDELEEYLGSFPFVGGPPNQSGDFDIDWNDDGNGD